MLHGETIHSILPWDLPWWMPDHVFFFSVLFVTLGLLCVAVTIVIFKSLYELASVENISNYS